jgi:hypothetical protein
MSVETDPALAVPDSDRPEGRTARTGVGRAPAVALVASLLAALVWIVAAALTAGRGFDTSDEGAYLLSYRWWSSNPRTFTGVQYLYGPVFQALGYDIAGLRLVRLLTIVVAHVVFGYSFMRWLRLRRPAAPPTRLWEFAGTAAILAGGGATYAWLPLSPGYNDVCLLGGLLATAVVLRAATYVERGRPVPAWVPLAAGPVVVATVFAKWTSSIVMLAVIAAVAVLVLTRRGWREVAKFAGWAVLSMLVSVGLIDLLIVPLGVALPELITVNKLVASKTNSPVMLLQMYWATSVDLVVRIAKRHGLILVAVALAVAGRGNRWVQRVAAVLAAAGVAVAVWRLAVDNGATGGTGNLGQYPVALLGPLLVALAVGFFVLAGERFTRSGTSSVRRESWRGWAVYAMVALLPVTQALGTGNPLYDMAVNGFGAWVALIVAVLTGIEATSLVTRGITVVATAGAIALASAVATTGLWWHPYRTAGHSQATAVVQGVPALSSVRLAPATAQAYSKLRHDLAPYLDPPGRAVMAFDEMAGVVLLLDGRPVGEAWYSAIDRERSADGIRATCAGGKPWWGDRAPLLLFRRPVSQTEIDALAFCGLRFDSDYRLLEPREDTMGLWVYVPTKGH